MNTTNGANSGEQLESTAYEGKDVRLCEDGKYRWTYPMNMLTNPSIYLTVIKILGSLMAIAYILLNLGAIFHGEFAKLFSELKWWGVAVLVFFAVTILGYLLVVAMYGGKYIVNFTMDENGITHEQIPAQSKKARKLGAATAGAGVLTGSVGRIGQGMMVAGHTSLESDFSKVRSVKPKRMWSTIKVNEPFAKNQVYTTKEDFDFVLDYILKHCPKVKK